MAKSIQSRIRLQDIIRILTGRPLDILESALIQKVFFGCPMDIPRIWILSGCRMNNQQDVKWIGNATWEYSPAN